MVNFFVVRYTGPFGYIKPWTAVRDALTFSQSFVTPSIIEGLRQKLGVSEISRHKLRHHGIDRQIERTQSAGWVEGKTKVSRAQSILERGVLLQPTIALAFPSLSDAEIAVAQHICLCRNEDVLLPVAAIEKLTPAEFDLVPGIELVFEYTNRSFLVGFSRFDGAKPMYGYLSIVEDESE